MGKFDVLINILDHLRSEAPAQNKRYHPSSGEIEKLNQARSRAFIHLFLKVRFGMLDFLQRERLITDDKHDGGIDAYFIDPDLKVIYFVQSKFRTAAANFVEKQIAFKELLSMDIDRITAGEHEDEAGNKYNGKIQQLVRDITAISDIGRYRYQVILLANLKGVTPANLKKLTGGFPVIIYDNDRTFTDLVFPVLTGTFYNPSELTIYINLIGKSSASARVTYEVTTRFTQCDISVLFVPTIEIARTLYTYRNSILKFNPRSFLELANNNVNQAIASTIEDLSTNEFALFNNGITMLSYGTDFNEKIGQKDRAQLVINQPQIINGGQTAFTLSRLYEENRDSPRLEQLFKGKEVLLKVITLPPNPDEDDPQQLSFIESISKATNQQTPVGEADRRSNDAVQIQMQKALYDGFGYFYERKRGEFADGLRAEYINRSQIIDREIFLRLCKSCDLNPAEARRSSVKNLFKEENFARTLNDVRRYREYFFAFALYEELNKLERAFARDRSNRFGESKYGYALRYGKFAVVSVCMRYYDDELPLDKVGTLLARVLKRWRTFERYASTKAPGNGNYFTTIVNRSTGETEQYRNFDAYYKGRTINKNLESFFDR
jgi:hypothetical protein